MKWEEDTKMTNLEKEVNKRKAKEAKEKNAKKKHIEEEKVMNALELEVKKLKDKESREIQNKKKAAKDRINNDTQYSRLFYSKNFPLVLNGDATINGRIEGDTLKFIYHNRELEIRERGDPNQTIELYGLNRNGQYENCIFNCAPSDVSLQEQLIKMLKDSF
jgi:hypothetical protein